MLLRAFARRRPALLLLLSVSALAVGLCEGAFVLAAKAAVADARWRSWGIPLAIMAGLVTGRTLILLAAARWESLAVHGWLAGLRRRLLAAAAGKAFPAYRDPWRNLLVTSLGAGLDDLAEGLAAGFRCLAALAQAAALAPLLLLFDWRLAAAAAALAAPAWLAGRLKSRWLGAAADGRHASRSERAESLGLFAEGLEPQAGNGRLAAAAAALEKGLEAQAGSARRWETARAQFPPALEWFFFMALAALALLAGEAGPSAGAAKGPAALLPFGALLLLLYRPIREWARNHPAYALGNRAFAALGNLQATLDALPGRAPRPAAPGGGVRVEDVSFAYGAAPVFRGLEARLEGGELTWIQGPNGAGKSTLLKLIAGIEEPASGRILGPGGEAPCAYLPQRAFVEPDYADWAEGFRAAHPSAWRELDGILGLRSLLGKAGAYGRWEGLSGGERQRLCLGRVFASPALFLLLDEPTTWLTAADRERILGDLIAFWRRPRPDGSRRGGALVSHEPFLGEFCSRTLRLEPAPAGIRA